MKRRWSFALLLCTGCASAGGDNLLADSLIGDVASLFSSRDDSAAAVTAARSSVRSLDSAPANSNVAATAQPKQ
jgi:hypothetical protein